MTLIRLCASAAALLFLAGCETTGETAAGPSTSAQADGFLATLRTAPADAAAFTAYCNEGLALGARIRADLEARTGPAGIDTDFRTFDDLYGLISGVASDASLVSETNPDEATRAAAEDCAQRVDAFSTEISLSRPIYDRLAAVDVTVGDEALKHVHARTLAAYRRAGVDRDEATRARVMALQNQITETGLAFSRNIRDDRSEVWLPNAAALEGMPADYIAAHPPAADGRVRVTTTYPDVYPILTYATNEATRRAVWTAFRNRAWPANEQVLRDLVAQRYELARTLGYQSFAQLITEDKMIGTPERAAAFIDQLAGAARASAQRDYDRELKRLRRIDRRIAAVPVWSSAYAQQLIRREEYEVDPQVVRQYFNYPNVRDGIIALSSDMFGVEIRPWTNAPVWHESVQAFEMVEGGQVIGRFFLDMHPREGKFSHAAAFPIRDGLAGRRIPVAALVCNFPEGLMEHGDVETFLHEFGHLLHGLLSGRQQWSQASMGMVEWDFIEAPSQLLEEWVWDYDTLSRFARNAEGEVIPRALADRMRAARNFGEAEATLVQLSYAAISLNYYNRDPAGMDLSDFYHTQYERYAPYRLPRDVHPYASFGHLTNYSAIYYTYQWSLAIAVDMFSVFEQAGLRDTAAFARYRQYVLAPGGSQPANTLIENFLGRPTSVDAYARRLGQ